MKHLLILAATTFMSASAFAQSTTEYFHMPAAGAFEVTPHVGYRTMTTRAQAPGSTESNLSGLERLGAKAMYGINPLIAVGADLSYSTYTVNNGGPDNKGIEPLQLFLDGQLPMAMGNLQYGLLGSFGLEKAKFANNGVNRSFGDAGEDIAAGGFRLAPYLGYVFSTGSVGSFGGRVSYQLINSDASVETTNGGSATISGGSRGNATLFYETKAADIDLGAGLTYDWWTKVTGSGNGLTSDFAQSRSLIGVKLYANMPFGEGVSFLPSLSWREKASSDDLDKFSDLRFNVAGRFAF